MSLLKPLSITASAAQLLRGLAAVKSLDDSLCPVTQKDIFNIPFKNISKVYPTVAVKATRHHRAVGKYAEMVSEAVAKHPVTLNFGILDRPREAVAVF